MLDRRHQPAASSHFRFLPYTVRPPPLPWARRPEYRFRTLMPLFSWHFALLRLKLRKPRLLVCGVTIYQPTRRPGVPCRSGERRRPWAQHEECRSVRREVRSRRGLGTVTDLLLRQAQENRAIPRTLARTAVNAPDISDWSSLQRERLNLKSVFNLKAFTMRAVTRSRSLRCRPTI